MASQVEATIIKTDGNPAFPTPISMSFPTDEIKMAEVVSGTINSSIQWNGTLYYASETLASLITAANEGGGSSYLVYTALLSQSGTSAPTAAVQGIPTITGVTYGYDGTGNFYAASDDFVEGKTWWSFQAQGGYNSPVRRVSAEIVFNEPGYPSKMIFFITQDNAGSAINDWLAPMPIEIRVYP